MEPERNDDAQRPSPPTRPAPAVQPSVTPSHDHPGSASPLTLDALTQRATELARSLAAMRATLEASPDGILVIDERGTILVYNKACEGLFGYSPDEALGSNVRLIMPSDYADEHDQYLENYRETGHRKIIGIGREVRARHKDGTAFPAEVQGAYVLDERGFPVRLRVLFRDITERRRAEQALRESEERLEAALRGADLTLWDFDVASRRLSIAHGSSLGPPGDARGWMPRVHPDDIERLFPEVR